MNQPAKRIAYAVLSPPLVLASVVIMALLLTVLAFICPLYYLFNDDPFTLKKRGRILYQDGDGLLYDDEKMTQLSTGVEKSSSPDRSLG